MMTIYPNDDITIVNPKFPYQEQLELPFSTNTYQITLPKGKYILEAYGASGGGDSSRSTTARKSSAGNCRYTDDEVASIFKGNTRCVSAYSQPGAGGYAKGILNLTEKTTIYVTTGGQGQFGSNSPGGHNGGGKSLSNGSGGGATDFRVLNNSLFNRFLVAGAGGGSDDADNLGAGNDGSGGSGGLPGQGFWIDGSYKSSYETTTISGFSFGYGQDSISNLAVGAGSGFFGGKSYNNDNAGAAGGSSFALTEDADIPSGQITVKNGAGEVIETDVYKLTDYREYYLTEVVFATGVWKGDGMARITCVFPFIPVTCHKPLPKIGSLVKLLISFAFTLSIYSR